MEILRIQDHAFDRRREAFQPSVIREDDLRAAQQAGGYLQRVRRAEAIFGPQLRGPPGNLPVDIDDVQVGEINQQGFVSMLQ